MCTFQTACVLLLCSLVTGRVVELGDKFLEFKNREIWLIKFYAPWCGHCKQLEPVWSQVSQRLVDSDIRVSRLDCTKYTNIAQHFRVSGFPTIMYVSKDKQIEFQGERNVASIIDFVHRVHGPSVRKFGVCEDMLRVLRNQPAVFLLAAHPDGHQGAEELAKNFSIHAEHMHSLNYFIEVPLSCVNQTKPISTVYVYKDKTFSEFNETRFDSLEQWILSERFPAFQRITHANFNYLLGTKKLLVAAVLKENQIGRLESSRMEEVRDMLEALAINTRNLYHDKFLFGWFPSTDIPFSMAMTELALPSVMIIDPHSYRYFLPDDPEDPESIVRLLDAIIKDDPAPASFGGNTFFFRLYRSYFEIRQNVKNMYRSSPVLTVIIFIVPLGFFSAILYLTCCADLLDATADEEDDGDAHEKND